MFMLDTNICIYINKRKPPQVLERLERIPSSAICMSVITLAELTFGALKSQQVAANLDRVRALREAISIIPFDDLAAEAYGVIRRDLERAGQPIGSNDLFIAAHALALDAVLVTNNLDEFLRVPGLRVENWV